MANSRFKLAFTLGDLFIGVALVAIVIALVTEFRKHFSREPRLIQSIWFSGDGTRLFAAFQDGGVSSWDLETGSITTHIGPSNVYHTGAPVVISPDGRLAARILWHNPPPPEGVSFAVQVCDVQTGRELWWRKRNFLGSMAFSPDGARLAIDNPSDNTMSVIEFAHPEREVKLSPLDTKGPKAEDSAWSCPILFSSDGNELYRVSADNELTKWNIATGQAQRRQLENGWHNLLQLPTSDGRLVITCTRGDDAERKTFVDLRDSDNLEQISHPALLGYARSIAAIDAGKSLVLNGGSGLLVIDTKTLEPRKSFDIAPDSWRLAARDTSRGPVIAVADEQTISLLVGNRFRTLVSLRPLHWREVVLAAAIPMISASWLWRRVLRRRAVVAREAFGEQESHAARRCGESA